MKLILYLFVGLCLSSQPVFGRSTTDSAGTKAQSSLSLGLGLNVTSLRNETISPLIHSGLGVPASLAYRREAARTKQYVQLTFINHSLTSRFGNATDELRSGLGYTYLRRTNEWQRTNLYAGVEIATQFAIRTNPFGANNISGESLNSANATALMDYVINRHKVEAQVAVSVVGYNIRTRTNGYLGSATEGTFNGVISTGHWESLPAFLNGYVRLTYIAPTSSPHFGCRFDYTGSFNRFRQQQYLGIAQNQLTVSLIYRFNARL